MASVNVTSRSATVYNIRVAEDHTYFVGREAWGFSVWVHNTYKVVPGKDGLFDVVDAKGNLVRTGYPDPDAAQLAIDSRFLTLGRGSTANLQKGTTLARNLREKLAIEHVISNPTAGNQLPITLADARWSATDGWVKMEQVIQTSGREGPIRVHYVYDTITGAIDDFKIVLQGAR